MNRICQELFDKLLGHLVCCAQVEHLILVVIFINRASISPSELNGVGDNLIEHRYWTLE